MGVRRQYRGIPEPNLSSYDFYDLATGTGYKNFNGFDCFIDGSGTMDYLLTTQSPYAHAGVSSASNTSTLDLDFDVTFEVPITIDGVAVIQVPCLYVGASDHFDLTINIYKVVSGVETQLGLSIVKTTPDSWTNGNVMTGEITIPVTRFAANDKLRLNLVTTAPGAGRTLYIYHDPKNRTGLVAGATVTTSQLILNLPIKI